MLEALKLKIPNNPHRSEITVREYGSRSNLSPSEVEITVTVESDEIKDSNSFRFNHMTVPIPADGRLDRALTALNNARDTGLNIQGFVTDKGINTELHYGLYEPGSAASTQLTSSWAETLNANLM